MSAPTPDDFAVGSYFTVTLDDEPVKEESHFRTCSGLDITIDVHEYREGGTLTPRKLPGPPRYSNLVLSRGVSASTAFMEWIKNAANRNVQRVGGKVSLVGPDGTPIIEWMFEKGWPCRYEGPKLDASRGVIVFETVEIAHEGLSLQA